MTWSYVRIALIIYLYIYRSSADNKPTVLLTEEAVSNDGIQQHPIEASLVTLPDAIEIPDDSIQWCPVEASTVPNGIEDYYNDDIQQDPASIKLGEKLLLSDNIKFRFCCHASKKLFVSSIVRLHCFGAPIVSMVASDKLCSDVQHNNNLPNNG